MLIAILFTVVAGQSFALAYLFGAHQRCGRAHLAARTVFEGWQLQVEAQSRTNQAFVDAVTALNRALAVHGSEIRTHGTQLGCLEAQDKQFLDLLVELDLVTVQPLTVN